MSYVVVKHEIDTNTAIRPQRGCTNDTPKSQTYVTLPYRYSPPLGSISACYLVMQSISYNFLMNYNIFPSMSGGVMHKYSGTGVQIPQNGPRTWVGRYGNLSEGSDLHEKKITSTYFVRDHDATFLLHYYVQEDVHQ